ncbi:hypothetical protein GSI_08876 [Ganoderma sinense ZZ0214-1]|uniref:F-box domain-containing protein n=1 Tax=Ganoderma sinense ZZ0214-1 TaxID=1077348 RepID=A0A2G8S4Z9_9APHY|nr:hypothetical protein GSI_08876 [Ganoderma sinense ZZ0214-1]
MLSQSSRKSNSVIAMEDSEPQEPLQPNPRNRAPLNLDVLNTIFVFTNYPDLLSLSLTCSAFRPLAIRTLLRTRPVVLKNIATIPKFRDFIFSDGPARTPHIIALIVDVAHNETTPDPETSERAIEALIAILRHAPSLKSLELISSANERPIAYLDDPRLSAAVGEVASLRELTIGGKTKVTDFIGAMRSPITKLTLRFLEPAGGIDDSWSPISLCAALSPFAHSLESLAIEHSNVRLAGNPPGSAVSTSAQFYALRSLTFTNLVAVPHLALFFKLFPNLDGTVHLTGSIYDLHDLESEDDSEHYNFSRRAREQNGTAQEGRCWTRLERLICDVWTLFVLNLQCPIGLTMIQECPADADSLERRYLVESLRDHPPTRLNLHVTASWNGGFDEPSLGGMIPPEAATTLTHLTLFVEYKYNACPSESARKEPLEQNRRLRGLLLNIVNKIQSVVTRVRGPSSIPTLGSETADTRWSDLWRDTLLPGIEHLHALTHFRLAFHCIARQAEDPGRPISEEPLVEDLRPSSGFDFTAVASAIADALPSLQFCFITNSARVVDTKFVYAFDPVERWCESRAWRIVPHAPFGDGIDHPEAMTPHTDTLGTRKALVELEDGVAEAIIEMEDLDLSIKEEAKNVATLG